MLRNDLRREGVVDPEHAHLHEQALGEVDGGDTDRIELLNLVPDTLHVLDRGASLLRDCFDLLLQVAVFVQVSDYQGPDLALQPGEVRKPELPQQVIGERDARSEIRFERRPIVGPLGTARERPRLHVVLPVDVADELVRGWLTRLRSRIGRLRPLCLGLERGRLLTRGLLLGLASILVERLFQDRILDKLLLDAGLELEPRQLEQLDRLLQLGSHDELLAQPEIEFELERKCHSQLQPEVLAEVDLAYGRVGGDLSWRSFADDPPILDDVGPIADREGVAHVVVRDDDSDTAFTQLRDDLLDVYDGDRVDAGKGLVQQHEARFEHQRARNLHSAAFATGEGRPLLLALVEQVELTQQAVQPFPSLAAGDG